jgi:sulfite reductase (NADPH) flavoprotein alpha-component
VASSFLAERADDVPVPVFPSNAKHFICRKIPIRRLLWWGRHRCCPFRAYLQERQVTGAKGKNWLFFGAQHVNCDFAYEEDFDTFMKEGDSHAARLRLVTRSG